MKLYLLLYCTVGSLGELAGDIESDELIVSESIAAGIDSTDVVVLTDSVSAVIDSNESFFSILLLELKKYLKQN